MRHSAVLVQMIKIPILYNYKTERQFFAHVDCENVL